MTIERRPLGSSGLQVAPLALGGNVFGWTADEATSFRILDAFVDAGGNMIDTADVYSAWVPGNRGGESETVIGNWLRRDPSKRDKVVIATKVGFMAGLKPETIASACEASMQRLGTDIDLYYHHKDDPEVPFAESLGAMDRLAKAGKVRAIGLSQYSPERLDEALGTAETEGFIRPCALQTWYNLVERQKLKYRDKADLDKSPRGLRNAEYLEGKGLRVLEALDEVAAETGAPLAAVALAWTNAQPGITATLASATSLAQLEEQLASIDLELTAAQMARLSDASS